MQTLEEYFAQSNSPMPNSPVGTTMVRVLEKYPSFSFEQARQEAQNLLDKAARSFFYHTPQVLSPEEKQQKRDSFAKFTAARAEQPAIDFTAAA
jgi:hypothetical protein